MTATELTEEAARIAEEAAAMPLPPSTARDLGHEIDRYLEPDPAATALIPAHDELTVLAQLAVTFAQAGLVPKALQGKPADVLLVLMTGRGLGIDPMVALRECHPVDGKVTVSPKLKLAIVRQRDLGQVWPDEANDAEEATWHATRNDDPRATVYSASYSMTDAKAAGLAKKDNWQKYPRQMLQWRALGYLLDVAFGEVGTGLYAADELDAVTDDEGRPVIDVTEVAPLAGIEPKAKAGSSSTANDVCPVETQAEIKSRIDRLPPPAVVALKERWSKPDPVNGTPTLWPLGQLPNRQVKAANALIDSVEKQAKAGAFGEWVGAEATDAPDSPPAAPETPSTSPKGEQAPDPATGTTGADEEPADADLVCCGPDCDELAVTVTLDGEAWCAEHQPI